MKLVLTEAALSDLRSISAFTRQIWGEEQEAIYLDKIWTRFETIRAAPEHYRLRDDLFPGCRIASEGRHVILFRAHPEEALQVVRVLHAAMDFKRHLD